MRNNNCLNYNVLISILMFRWRAGVSSAESSGWREVEKKKKKNHTGKKINNQRIMKISQCVTICLLSCLIATSCQSGQNCDISEFKCPAKDGKQQAHICIPMDRWCNGKDDCDNRHDEPRSCTCKTINFTFNLFFKNYYYFFFRSAMVRVVNRDQVA